MVGIPRDKIYSCVYMVISSEFDWETIDDRLLKDECWFKEAESETQYKTAKLVDDKIQPFVLSSNILPRAYTAPRVGKRHTSTITIHPTLFESMLHLLRKDTIFSSS